MYIQKRKIVLKRECKNWLHVCVIALLALFVLTFFIAATSAEGGYIYITKWGSSGTGDGQFNYPHGVAVDSSGDVFVADSGNSRIQKFDSSGTFITKWGSYGTGDGQFNYPQGVAVDSSGDVFVADTYNEQIQKFDSNGNFITRWGSQGGGDGQFSRPSGVAVDSSGDVFVADAHNHRIQKFDSNGNFITRWGSLGSGDGQFNHPYGVAVDSSGDVFVADTANNRIQKFDSNGTFITKWGSYGTGDGQFKYPPGVAVDSSGDVFVADRDNHRIQKFDSNGNFITKWGSRGTGNGQFNFPSGVAVDSSGDVFVADTSNHRIQKFGEGFAPPHVTGINPDYGYRGETLDDVFITGSDFRDVSMTVELQRGAETIGGTDVLYISDTEVTCDFDLTGASVGTWDVYLKHNDDDQSSTLDDAFFVHWPAISVSKTADPTSGAPSTDVTFTIEVTNTGDCPLGPVKVVDTLPDGMSYVSAGTSPVPDSTVENADGTWTITWNNVGPLAKQGETGDSTTISLIAHIDGDVLGTLTDSVIATGTPPHGDDVTDDDTADVTALASGISVTKTADPTSGAPSTDVTFTIEVTNTGDCPLGPVKVVDTLPDGMSYVSAGTSPVPDSTVENADGTWTITWNNVGPLAKQGETGDSTTISLIAHIDGDVLGTLTDSVIATGTPPHGDDVTDDDTAEVTALASGISVTKTADPTSGAPSTDVTFTIEVTNTGDCPLGPVKAVDTLPDGMSYVSAGTSPVPDSTVENADGTWTITWNNVGPLAKQGETGDSTTISLVAHIDTGASGTLTDSVTATGTPPHGDDVEDTDTADVTVLSVVSVELEKSGSPPTVALGGTVTYTINYTNTGAVPLTNVVITENYPDGVTFISASPAPDAGTNNVWTIGTLAAGESGTIIIKVKVPEQIDLSFTETGSVIGEGVVKVSKDRSTEQRPYSLKNEVTLSCAELPPISAYATTNVTIAPEIEVNKTASLTGTCPGSDPLAVSIGDTVTYCFNVSNRGDVTLTSVTVNDDVYGLVTLGTTTLAPGETTEGTLTHVVVASDAPSVTNIATATGTDPLGGTVTDTDDCTIDMTIAPGIKVVKTASLTGTCPGSDPLAVNIDDTVTYCFNVSNTGDVNLTGVTVIDDIYGPVTLGTTTLAPGESTEGTVTHVVTESDVPSVTNIATVNATDIDNNRVSDTDDCTINVEPSPCFIATAAYGTALHEDINVLREFRDEYLVTNPAGRVFVKIYYTTSPPVAALIRDNEGLSTPVREGFVKPLVYITRQFVKGGGQNG